MNSGNKDKIDDNPNENPERDIMNEAHQELDDSKKSIRDLIRQRRSIYGNDKHKMNEYMDRAIDAINNLFDEDLPEEKKEE